MEEANPLSAKMRRQKTFDSDLWDGVREVKDLIYSMESLKPSYIGLTEAPPNNIMPGR